MPPAPALAALWTALGLPTDALDDVRLTGADPVLASSFAVGTAAQVAIAAAGLAAATLHRLRTGTRQTVGVDMRHAATEFHSEEWQTLDGMPMADRWDAIAGLYPCGDGSWVRLHTNFPHHRDGVLRLLGCAYDRAAVAAALQAWTAFDFEDAAAAAGLCVTAQRSFAEWDAHPQGQAVQAEPLVAITKIGEAPPEPLPPGPRPLSGVRELDLTRVLAGPVCGRTLAAHGAEVLLITGPHLYNPRPLTIDTGRGKRSAQLDLRADADRATLRALLRDADLFVQGYRPGALAAHGFSTAAAAELRPGIVCGSICAWGFTGPWAARRGFDSLVQTASGFNTAEAEAAGDIKPKPLPVQALDHASGYLLAAGTLAALHRRATIGGSWHVQVSLARTGHWIRSLGRIRDGLACPPPTPTSIADLTETQTSGFGRLRSIRHAAELSATPAAWTRPSVPPGTDPPVWEGGTGRRQ